jgi:hypothetical protein
MRKMRLLIIGLVNERNVNFMFTVIRSSNHNLYAHVDQSQGFDKLLSRLVVSTQRFKKSGNFENRKDDQYGQMTVISGKFGENGSRQLYELIENTRK